MNEKKMVELIHKEFDEAVVFLKEITESYKDQASRINPDDSVEEEAKILEDLGFSNVKVVRDAREKIEKAATLLQRKKNLESKAKQISKEVAKQEEEFPFHKFILYSQVIRILEKYNLHIAPVEIYKGEIPKKNVGELKQFVKSVKSRKHVSFLGPICAGKNVDCLSPGVNNLYICAPKTDFQLNRNVVEVGRELVVTRDMINEPLSLKSFLAHLTELRNRPKDPIVLYPMVTRIGQPGFIVVTKWGLEAEDPELVVPKLN